MFAAVIFDLDGTLVDSESALITAQMAVFTRHGHKVDAALFHRLIGVDDNGSRAILAQALGDGIDFAALEAEIKQHVRSRFKAEGVPLRPGAVALLDRLSGMGMPMAVATSSRAESAAFKIGHSGLAHHFRAVVSRDDVEDAKPAPDPFLLAAKLLGVEPGQCLAFEDSDIGARSAKAAGMTVVQVPDMLPTRGEDADLVAPDLITGAERIGLI